MFLPTAARKGTNASSASTGEREDDADGPDLLSSGVDLSLVPGGALP